MRKMKDSGIEWIGDIPEGWEVRRYKYLCKILSGFPFKSEYFSNNGGTPLIRIRDITSGNIETFYAGEFDELYLIKKGTILVGMDGDFNIRIWDNENALLNQRCCAVYNNCNSIKLFLFYSLPFILSDINRLKYATTVKHLSTDDILNSYSPYPPIREQQRIADYLDAKCPRIDEAVELVRQSMEKLRAYKLSLITEAVTKGLDPDVLMKDSGIPWIGKIPISWNCLPLKRVVTSVKTGSTPKGAEEKYYAENGLKWFTPADFTAFPYIDSSAKKLSESGINEVKIFPQDSVLLIGIGATMGKVALACSQCAANQQINSIQCKKELLPLFLTFYLSTITDYLFKCGKFTTLPILNQEETKNIYIPLPPLSEQQRIADYLDAKCARIDAVLEEKKRLLERLAEYKKSLIFECVTGKREVSA